MNKILIALLLLTSVAFSQETVQKKFRVPSGTLPYEPVYTRTTFTNATLDTTTWFSVEPTRDVSFLVISTDSAALDIYVDGRNSFKTNTLAYVTYADSLTLADSASGFTATNTSGLIRKVLLKTTTLNRLNQPANDEARLRVDHRASGAGTTSGRTITIYAVRNRP